MSARLLQGTGKKKCIATDISHNILVCIGSFPADNGCGDKVHLQELLLDCILALWIQTSILETLGCHTWLWSIFAEKPMRRESSWADAGELLVRRIA